MLSDASRRARKINFNEQFPGLGRSNVINNRDIPGSVYQGRLVGHAGQPCPRRIDS